MLTRVLIVWTIALMVSIPAHGETDGNEGQSAEIRASEEALTAAMHTRNSAGLERLLAPDYILRGVPDVDRATWLRNALTLCWGDRSEIDRFRARQHDGVVIATFELTFHRDPTTCRPATLRSEITDIWVQEPEGWRLQMRHATPPPPADAGVVPQYGIVPLPPPTWDTSSELSFVATGGTTTTRTVGLGGDITHRTNRVTSRASVAYLSSEAGAVTNARSLSVTMRQGWQLGKRSQVFGEGAYVRDEFAGIDGRTTATGGLAYSAAISGPHRLTLDIGAGMTSEQHVDDSMLQFASASVAAHYRWAVVPGTQLAEDVAFTSDLQSGRNWRQASTTAVSVTLSRLLSFKASHSIEYRNVRVADLGRTDMKTAAALVFSFQQRPNLR